MKTIDDLQGVWTWVCDNNSGAVTKTGDLFVQGDEEEAMDYVRSQGYHPYGMTCECCGLDFDFTEDDDIIKMAVIRMIGHNCVCEWDKWGMRMHGDTKMVITYEMAQQIVLDYVNGKKNPFTLIKFVFGKECHVQNTK